MRIEVIYYDDNFIKHLCIVTSLEDLYFLQSRFEVIYYEVLS